MPRIEKQMKYCGITVREVCMRCGYLNPEIKERYRCACHGHCPSFLTEEEKAYLLTHWCPVDVPVKTYEEVVDEHQEQMAKEMEDLFDAEILARMKKGDI